MRDVWARVEAVLRTTAPERFAALASGAAPATIAAVERQLGVTLPAEVRESYAIHDGSGFASVLAHRTMGLIDVIMLSLADVARDRAMWLEWWDSGSFANSQANPHGPIKRQWWSRSWVPLTWDGGGDHLCIDLDPAPGGVMGQVLYFSHEVGPVEVVASSWQVYLEEYAADLETGRLRFANGKLVAGN